MKIITTLILIALTVTITAQTTSQKRLSEAELFSNKAGTLIEKQFETVGEVKGVRVIVMRIFDLNNKLSMSALRFEYDYRTELNNTFSKIAVLDKDEIDGLQKSLLNLASTVFPSKREVYTEVSFVSNSGFEAGAYFKKSRWVGFLKIVEYDNDSFVSLDGSDFSMLMALVQTAKNKM